MRWPCGRTATDCVMKACVGPMVRSSVTLRLPHPSLGMNAAVSLSCACTLWCGACILCKFRRFGRPRIGGIGNGGFQAHLDCSCGMRPHAHCLWRHLPWAIGSLSVCSVGMWRSNVMDSARGGSGSARVAPASSLIWGGGACMDVLGDGCLPCPTYPPQRSLKRHSARSS